MKGPCLRAWQTFRSRRQTFESSRRTISTELRSHFVGANSSGSVTQQYSSIEDYQDAVAASQTQLNHEEDVESSKRPGRATPGANGWTKVSILGKSAFVKTLRGPSDWDQKPPEVTPVLRGGGVLGLELRDQFVPLSARWLRDLCSCPLCRHPDTAQRQVNVFQSHAAAVQIAKADLSSWPDQLFVTFADGHETNIPASIILDRYSIPTVKYKRNGIIQTIHWNSSIQQDPPVVQYNELDNQPGMGLLLQKLRIYGFCFVDEVPATPEATQTLLESIGPIRNTHYGGFYDFTSDLSSKDTAYTSEALEPHTDNTYFTEPAGLQALHLLSHTNGTGGESSLVDGFAAADQLRQADHLAYQILSTTGVHAHASGNEGVSIQPAQPYPILTHSSDAHRLMQVRWNNADRAGITAPWQKIDAWYEAAAKFDAILNDAKNQFWFQLKPGRMLIFDNWRVLHGRAAFTGKRRMCGGYINRDDFISRFRATNLSKEEIVATTVTG
ncbi:hypothetical protein LTR62_008381 [Meristemomyces frigidus]|uniref:trimethyllysine dioxygenase n=1 Tax=Meristemomyces frigidus TaxID=1508187 RepID=A0AAN7T9I3_9PEZI|nr:hypothetical protein LTR62_008381 [Meristemomyces frigidus]